MWEGDSEQSKFERQKRFICESLRHKILNKQVFSNWMSSCCSILKVSSLQAKKILQHTFAGTANTVKTILLKARCMQLAAEARQSFDVQCLVFNISSCHPLSTL